MQSDSRHRSFFNSSTLTQHRDTYAFIDPYRFKNALTGKIVLITSAHRGIGRASALDFAFAGATVICVARTKEQLQPVISELKARGSRHSYGFPMDITDPNAPATLIKDVEQEIGPVDILLNVNSGPYPNSFVHNENFLTEWWSVIERNLRTPIALIHAVLPSMIARGSGTIITTTFRTGAQHMAFTTPISTSDSAIIRFHHGLDDEVRPKGVYSYAVHPGLIASLFDDPETPLHTRHLALEPRIQEEKTSTLAANVGEQWCGAGLATGTFLALAADPKTRVLSGLYVDAERDMGELIEEIEKGEESRVKKENLYVLKVDEL